METKSTSQASAASTAEGSASSTSLSSQALRTALSGGHLLLTGGTGTGKTTLLKLIARELLAKGKDVVRLDPTLGGVCELHQEFTGGPHGYAPLPAQSVYDWLDLGWAMYQQPLDISQLFMEILLRAKQAPLAKGRSESRHSHKHELSSQSTRQRVASAQVLVIDHWHMLSDQMWSILDAICQACSGSTRPFGGKQVILAADFQACLRRKGVAVGGAGGAAGGGAKTPLTPQGAPFQESFRVLDAQVIELTEDKRRMAHPAFATALKHMGLGYLTEEDRACLTACTLSTPVPGALRVYPTRQLVDQANTAYLSGLTGESWTFTVAVKEPRKDHNDTYHVACPEYWKETITKQLQPIPLVTIFKAGARVRTVREIDVQQDGKTRRIPKNAIGTVTFVHEPFHDGRVLQDQRGVNVHFDQDGDDGSTVIVRRIPKRCFVGENCVVEAQYMPLVLAHAVTLEAVKGRHLDHVVTSIDESCFLEGMAYQLCSLVDRPQALFLEHFRPESAGLSSGSGGLRPPTPPAGGGLRPPTPPTPPA